MPERRWHHLGRQLGRHIQTRRQLLADEVHGERKLLAIQPAGRANVAQVPHVGEDHLGEARLKESRPDLGASQEALPVHVQLAEEHVRLGLLLKGHHPRLQLIHDERRLHGAQGAQWRVEVRRSDLEKEANV